MGLCLMDSAGDEKGRGGSTVGGEGNCGGQITSDVGEGSGGGLGCDFE